MSWHKGFTGPDEMRAARKAVGWSQGELAKRSGFSRRTVAYHEQKPGGRIDGVAPARFRAVLIDAGAKLAPIPPRAVVMPSYAQLALYSAPVKVKRARAVAPPRPPKPPALICGANTRHGDPCKAKAIPGKRRCKNHGGMSTGPKTVEGIARIAAAQRARHAKEGHNVSVAG